MYLQSPSQSVTAGGTTQDECYDYTTGSQLSQAWPAATLPCPASPPSGSTTTTSYVYDASGSLLAEDNPGSDTLYLPGEQITATTSGGVTTAITGIRFIPLPGGGQAVRTGAGTSYDYETSDQHGTSLLVLDQTLQNPAWRQFTPYGAPRGTAVTWPDTNGYLGDPLNTADGLTTIGARQYNPVTGRFLTPDPILEAGDPTQMGGYAYAAGNPVSQSDPTGLSAPGGSICTGSPGCNTPGDQPPHGWNGPGYPTWTSGNPGASPVQVSPHVYAADNDPQLAQLQAAYQWASAYEASIGGAQDELDIWWRACTISPDRTACGGQLSADFGGLNLNYGLGAAFNSGIKIVLGQSGSVTGYMVPLIGGVASSRILARNLIAAGYNPPGPGAAAHHIAAGRSLKAGDARAILEEYGVDINSSENGLWLPANRNTPDPWGAVHSTTHTDEYYSSVNEQLAAATSRDEVVAILDNIRSDLLGMPPTAEEGGGDEAGGGG